MHPTRPVDELLIFHSSRFLSLLFVASNLPSSISRSTFKMFPASANRCPNEGKLPRLVITNSQSLIAYGEGCKNEFESTIHHHDYVPLSSNDGYNTEQGVKFDGDIQKFQSPSAVSTDQEYIVPRS
jgi:hypothetical protein